VKIVHSMRAARDTYRGVVGLVPTMGFFHEGHLSLMEAAVDTADTTVVSLFVNPLQFDDPSDLDRYPSDHDRDASLAEGVGVDVLVIPSVGEMFPLQPLTRVSVGTLSEGMEGRHRPGHFDGVATVVAKLFAALRPDRAFFGRKDAQQLAIIRRMALDLSFDVEVLGQPLVREADGLALSSRNVLLGEHRHEATGLSRGLMAAADAATAGERQAGRLATIVRAASTGVDFEYVTLADVVTMQPIDELDRDAVLAVAAAVGPVRLIDNLHITLDPDGIEIDRGVRLHHNSVLYDHTIEGA